MTETIISIAASLISIGMVYGSLMTRIKQLEKQIENVADVRERLARIEENQKYILNELKK